MRDTFERIFFGLVILTCLFAFYQTACTPAVHSPPVDPSKLRFVVCSDIFGAPLYEGPASEVWVLEGAVHLVEPSGTEVVIVNVECMVIMGTSEQLDQSMKDHTIPEGPGDGDESF